MGVAIQAEREATKIVQKGMFFFPRYFAFVDDPPETYVRLDMIVANVWYDGSGV